LAFIINSSFPSPSLGMPAKDVMVIWNLPYEIV